MSRPKTSQAWFLSTARLLQQLGKEVTIYTKTLPPETTSNSAGGLWLPYSLFDPDRETPQFHQQYLQSVKFSYTYFQQFAGDDYSVRWMPIYVVTDEPFSATEMLAQDLFPRFSQSCGICSPPNIYSRIAMFGNSGPC